MSFLLKALRPAVLFVATSLVGMGADLEVVSGPAKRQETLDLGKKLLTPKPVSSNIADPFHNQGYAGPSSSTVRTPVVVQDSTARSPRTGRDLLQAIATSLKPTGYYVIGGKETIVFGQKRINPGGFLTINFEGTEYTLEITSINRANFTLRLNREEFTRPIK